MKRKILIYLSSFNLSLNKFKKIYDLLEEGEYSLDFLKNNEKIKEILKDDLYLNFIENCNEKYIDTYIKNLTSQDVKVVTIFDEAFPEKLIGIDDCPLVLYCKGNISLLNEQGIAIVGTRTPTNYGKIVTEKFSTFLAENGFVIISGLAYGIDSISHRSCLEVNGKTIAVLGGGFNYIYPSEHESLAKEIAEKGLIVSEYSPSYKATKYSFPQRNRIIAGLSEGVLITEASLKSGTIHTKDFALDYGKDIFAIPGNVTSSASDLPNEIIKTAQGECVVTPQNILDYYHLNCKNMPKKVVQLSFEEEILINLLKNGEKDLEFLVENSKIPLGNLNGMLLTMEIRGLITRLPGGVYSIK